MADDNKTWQVKVNEFNFSLSQAEIDNVDLVQLSPTTFNLIKDHHSINATLVEADARGKEIKIEFAGEAFAVRIKDELDLVLEKMGFASANNRSIKEIKAPMPGLVLEITVAEGQEVKEGDKILVLAAMKMENSIMIHTQANVKKVLVKAGQAVEKGQVLVELA